MSFQIQVRFLSNLRLARHAPRPAVVRLATALVLAGALAGCGGQRPGGGDDREAAFAKLTAVALGTAPAEVATPATVVDAGANTAAAPAGATPLPDMDRMATQMSSSNPELPQLPTMAADLLPGDDTGGAGLPPDVAETQMRETRGTEEAKAQIANVDGLVSQQPALATFTPPAKPAPVAGRLVFLRGGEFYTANADGSGTSKLVLENKAMPSVWSPPDDPGRAWPSVDGKRVAFLAGSDASLWVMDVNGKNGRQIHANTLPNEMHKIRVGSVEQDVKLRPGSDYTLVLTPGGSSAMGVLVDNNEYHKHGQARVRVVHAARGLADTVIVPLLGGDVINRASYGRTSGETAFGVGPTSLEVRAQGGDSLATFDTVTLADKEVKTIFVYGEADALKINPVAYESGTRPAAGKARLRVFNSGKTPVDLTIDGQTTAVRGVAEGQLSPYVEAQGTLGSGELEDMRIDIYGLRAGETPIAWSPDGSQVAFISGETGQHDLWVASVDGTARQVTNDVNRELNPVWSPDGSYLMWQSLDDVNQTIAIVVQGDPKSAPKAVDLSSIRQLEKVPADKPLTFAQTIGWIDAHTLYLAPRSEQVTRGIWTYDAQSGKLAAAYRGPLEGLVWSDEAKAWAFNSWPAVWAQDAASTGEIFVLEVGGAPKRIVDAGGYYPQWAPDGKTLLFGEGKPTDGSGWRIAAIDRDGGGRRVLTDKLPIMQSSPPVPGPNFKVAWSRDGKTVLFSRVGRDYGLKDRVGVVGSLPSAGDDIENLYAVTADGKAKPRQMTDLTKAFYLNDLTPSPDGASYAFIGFTYLDRSQRLLVVPGGGGKPVSIDTPVRWFIWVP